MIKCKICKQEFNLIHWSHLAKHNITTQEYKDRFGSNSLASAEYREKRSKQSSGKNNPNFGNNWSNKQKQHMSNKKLGSTPWNKGKKIGASAALKLGILAREQKYKDGVITRPTISHSDVTKKKISDSIKEYALNNPEEMSNRAKKSLETKIEKGIDLAFFRGKGHTLESKIKISKSSKKAAQQKSQEAKDRCILRAKEIGLSVIDISTKYVELQCNTCQSIFTFTQQYLSESKIKQEMCPTCFPRATIQSKVEKEIADYILAISPYKVLTNNRSILKGKELDIYIPELHTAIEINGLYWHSDKVLTENGYHPKKDYYKWKQCVDLGINLITVYEDEWANSKEIVMSRLSNLFGRSKKVYARQTLLKEISSKEANVFLKQNHLQGSGRSNVRLGLYYNNELISVMTFSKENISRKITGWELNRFCSTLGITVVGGAGKLFTGFIRLYTPVTIISYSDNRWGPGKVYSKLGMEKISSGTPNYWYIQPNELARHHRYSFRKNQEDNQLLTEWQNRQLQGLNRIWDCGHTKWQWKA